MPEEEASEVFQEAKESQTSEDSSSPQPPPDQVPPEVTTPQPRVDGGLRAWLQVLGSFCLFFTSWYAYSHSAHSQYSSAIPLHTILRVGYC